MGKRERIKEERGAIAEIKVFFSPLSLFFFRQNVVIGSGWVGSLLSSAAAATATKAKD